MEEPTATIFAMLFHSHLTSLENMLLTQLLRIDMKVIEHMDSLQERPLTSHNTSNLMPAARKNEEKLSQCAWIIQWLCTEKLQRILCCLPWCCFSDLSLDDAKTHAKISSPELEIYISIHLCSYCNQLYQTSLPITVTNSIHISEEEKGETLILKSPQTTEEQKIFTVLIFTWKVKLFCVSSSKTKTNTRTCMILTSCHTNTSPLSPSPSAPCNGKNIQPRWSLSASSSSAKTAVQDPKVAVSDPTC